MTVHQGISELKQLTEHVYWFTPDGETDRPTLGAVAGTNGTLLVDAGNSPAHADWFLEALSKRGVAAPKYLVLTHWHWDHIFGTAAFNIPSFASQETKRIVEEMVGLDWGDEALDARVEAGTEIEFCRDMMKKELPDRSSLVLIPPDIAYTNEVDIALGNIICRLIHIDTDHSPDATIVHIPQDKVVFLGDCVYPDLYNGPRNYTTKKLFPLLDKILALEADFYLAGHHDAPMTAADMVEYADWLRAIGRTVEEVGADRERILEELARVLERPLDEDDVELIEEFLAGLTRPQLLD